MLSIIRIIFGIVVIVVLIWVAEVHWLWKKLERIEVSKEEGYSNREIGERINRSAKVINNDSVMTLRIMGKIIKGERNEFGLFKTIQANSAVRTSFSLYQ